MFGEFCVIFAKKWSKLMHPHFTLHPWSNTNNYKPFDLLISYSAHLFLIVCVCSCLLHCSYLTNSCSFDKFVHICSYMVVKSGQGLMPTVHSPQMRSVRFSSESYMRWHCASATLYTHAMSSQSTRSKSKVSVYIQERGVLW